MIESIGAIGNEIASTTANSYTREAAGSNDAFEFILDASKKVMNETNDYQLEAQAAQTDFLTGKSDNLVTVMLAQKTAETSLNFTVQVTNKLVDAYQELMSIQL